MPHTMLPTTEDIIFDILNWVCPECGGPMGKPTKEFKCRGECRTDWRDAWERSLRATTPQHLRPGNSKGSEIQDDARMQKRLTAFVNERDSEYSHFAATATSPRVLELHHLQEHSLMGTAQILGISTSAVKARLSHAKVALHRMPLLQSAGRSVWANAGYKEEFL